MRTTSGTVPGAYDNSNCWYAVNQGGAWGWSTPWSVSKKNYYFMGIVLGQILRAHLSMSPTTKNIEPSTATRSATRQPGKSSDST